MSRNEAINWLVLTYTLDQRMSGCLVVTTLYIERVQPWLEDQRGQDRRPGLEEINERLAGGEDFDQLGRQPALEVGRTSYITLVETHGGPSILDMCSVSRFPLRDVLISRSVHLFAQLEVGIGVDGRRCISVRTGFVVWS